MLHFIQFSVCDSLDSPIVFNCFLFYPSPVLYNEIPFNMHVEYTGPKIFNLRAEEFGARI